jgi:hypothetical protein
MTDIPTSHSGDPVFILAQMAGTVKKLTGVYET